MSVLHIHGLARLLGVMALVCVLASCARNPQSVSLSLTLTQGMERTTRFTTEQRVTSREGAARWPALSSLSLTYRFRVASVDAARTAKLECSVREARMTRGSPAADAYLKTLTGQRLFVTVDKDGRVLAVKNDAPAAFAFGGGPLAPDALGPRTPAQGDLQGFFGVLGGGTVCVGDTWTSTLPQSGAQNLQGTIHWTLASVAGATARLEYSGRLDQKQLPVAGLPPGKSALLAGSITGYVLMELDTGWPTQGRSVTRAEVTLRDTGALDNMATHLVSLEIIMRFEDVK